MWWLAQILAFMLSLEEARSFSPRILVASSIPASSQSASILPRKAVTGDESSYSPEKDNEADSLPNESGGEGEEWLSQVLCGPPSSPWILPNSFEMFLNQCCIQSFLFLLKSLRDPQTVLWIEEFTQPNVRSLVPPNTSTPGRGSDHSKLLTYHGLAAMNTTLFPTWSSYFSKLLEQPKEIYSIESDLAHVPSYELEINPASLCSRLISVREQIAREFVRDLQVIRTMGGYTLESYWNSIRQQREDTKLDPLREATERPNLLFLENHVDDEDGDLKTSPLRRGNFDLLILLATQESIHRILNNPNRKQEGTTAELTWYLENFYVQRLSSHFGGRLRYRQADDFLEELLAQPPGMKQSSEETTALIDPIRLAEIILREREQVASEWMDIAAHVPVAHTEIKRLQLSLLMSIPNAPTGEMEELS